MVLVGTTSGVQLEILMLRGCWVLLESLSGQLPLCLRSGSAVIGSQCEQPEGVNISFSELHH